MFIYSYKPGSRSARALAEALGIKRIRHNNSRFTGRRNPIVINWGASDLPDWKRNCRILNSPEHVKAASNKLAFFQAMTYEGHSDLVPPYTDDVEVAKGLLPVMCRTRLTGHSGAGIVVSETEGELVEAPLYVKYIKKSEEYRIHFFDNRIIDIQRKIKKPDLSNDEVNWKIRSHNNGFIYVRNNVNPCDKVKEVAKTAFMLSDLDFGAVDVIYNRHHDRAYVLEINTAPGLEGTTIQRYATMFGMIEE